MVTLVETLRNYQIKLVSSGDKFVANCPFRDHSDNTPSFVLYPSTDSFYCWGCHRGGDVVQFLIHYEQISKEEVQKKLGLGQDAVTEIESILKPPTLVESDYNEEVNFVVSGLVREKLQKGVFWERVAPILQKFDRRLTTEKLNEQEAKQIIDHFQSALNDVQYQ